jgi:pimeloyl-ACP methyl ester carboxylesterase
LDLPASPFRLAGLLKGESGPDLVVYIEGDGRAVVHGRPSPDPTPRLAQSYELALQDPAPVVLYLARVGQFMPAYAQPQYRRYWSEARLAPEAVEAASRAIDEVKRRVGASRIHLTGYSGGGGLAVLLAERRADVASLVTVAGLLDIDWWVANGGWLPLSGSLNPASQVAVLAALPQIHFYGREDKVVTPGMAQRFARLAEFKNLSLVGLDTDHYSGWTKLWRNLVTSQVVPLRLTTP